MTSFDYVSATSFQSAIESVPPQILPPPSSLVEPRCSRFDEARRDIAAILGGRQSAAI